MVGASYSVSRRLRNPCDALPPGTGLNSYESLEKGDKEARWGPLHQSFRFATGLAHGLQGLPQEKLGLLLLPDLRAACCA